MLASPSMVKINSRSVPYGRAGCCRSYCLSSLTSSVCLQTLRQVAQAISAVKINVMTPYSSTTRFPFRQSVRRAHGDGA